MDVDKIGTWEAPNEWTLPLTEGQLATLRATPAIVDVERVMCIRIRPKGEHAWVVGELPIDPAWMDGGDDGEVWEVQFGVAPLADLDGMPEFDGW